MTASGSLHRREFIKLSVAAGLAWSVSTHGEAAADPADATTRARMVGHLRTL